MIIDSHLHIGLNNWTEDYLLKYLDSNGIEKAWILTWDEYEPVAPLYYIPLDIEIVRKAFRNHPDRIVPFYAPDPKRADWKAKLSKCLDEGFAGCGELKVPYSWDNPLMQSLLEFLDDKGLPLIFHMERARKIFIPRRDSGADWLFKRLINERFNGSSAYLIEALKSKTGFLNAYLNSREVDFPGYLLDLGGLEEAAKKYSQIQFIMHGPHIWNNFSRPKKEYLFHQSGKFQGPGIIWDLLESQDNIYCDISGFSGFNALKRDVNVTREFLNTFHKKLLFGTDNSEMGLLKFIKDLDIESGKINNILYRNAEHILGN